MFIQLGAQSAVFRFMTLLTGELSNGHVDLPAFPEVVARIKNALSKDDVTPAKIAQLVAAEAGLAARLMTIANSAMLNPSGNVFTELKSAIVRIGYNTVRTAAVAYAVAKLREADELRPIRKELETLWHESIVTAALTWATARQVPHINVDEAMLTGLVHNIGKVYILSRSQRLAGGAFAISDTVPIVRDWHANVGRAIVESWQFAAHIAAAVGEYEEFDRVVRKADMVDVLQIATLLRPSVADPQLPVSSYLSTLPAYTRLSLDDDKLKQIIHDATQAVSTLHGALGN